MSLSNDDHVVLLLSCIQHSDIQKIDFAAVAQQCNITTSGAAAKRYQRLLEAHREGKFTGGDNGVAGAGPSGINQAQGQSQSQSQNQNTSGPAIKGKKRKELAPKEDGNGDEPAPKRKRGRPPKAEAQAELAAEENQGAQGDEDREDDISLKEEPVEAIIMRKVLGEDETKDEDE
ncbi:hypothetical protein BDW75DRAFT_244270 [Aspergillus navahoensis]